LVMIVPFLVLAATAVRSRAVGEDGPRDEIIVSVLDVGQGDAMVIDGPGEEAEVVIDGGPGEDLSSKVANVLGRDRTLNMIILTHPHADHLAGLADMFARYSVEQVLTTGVRYASKGYDVFLDAVSASGATVTMAVRGQVYDFGEYSLEVLSPPHAMDGASIANLNNASVVIMMTDRRTGKRMLFTGDAEAEVESELVAAGASIAADVLKVSHHGSQDASSPAFLQAVDPSHAVLSVGAKNRFRHPHLRTLKRLGRTDATIWRTDRDGTVAFHFTPQGLSVVGAQ
jgi:competence protein ComEC